MKKLILFFLAAVTTGAIAQIQTPAQSSAGMVSSRVGLTDVKIDYSRPKMKGRKIFGEGADFLVPFGKIWRTGANYGTRINFSEDVKVEGIAVPKGEYLIFTWPGAAEWTISLYKDLDLGGNTEGYDATKEAARFKVKPEKLTEKVETFTFAIGDISEDNTTGKVQLAWENTSVKFAVVDEYNSRIEDALNEDALVAAHFYFENKKDAKTATKWINEYFSNGKHDAEFWNLHFKAQIQKGAGDKAGALATANKSNELAKKNKEGDFGYVKRNDELIKSLSAAK